MIENMQTLSSKEIWKAGAWVVEFLTFTDFKIKPWEKEADKGGSDSQPTVLPYEQENSEFFFLEILSKF